MMQILNCPLCKEEVFSNVGFGCLMCGMPLSEEQTDFCSEACEDKYREINIE